jgi:hypothetical protein
MDLEIPKNEFPVFAAQSQYSPRAPTQNFFKNLINKGNLFQTPRNNTRASLMLVFYRIGKTKQVYFSSRKTPKQHKWDFCPLSGAQFPSYAQQDLP